MSLKIAVVREQLRLKLQMIADNHSLGDVKKVFPTAEPFEQSGVYLYQQVLVQLRTGDAALVTVRSSTIQFFADIVVHPDDFDGPIDDMPDNLDALVEEVIDKVYGDNFTNHGDTTKAPFTLADIFHTYEPSENRGIANFMFEVPYTLAK
jgi:hypothetical protein